MIDKLLKVLESRRTTFAAIAVAVLLLFTDGETAVALTNDMGVPANISLKLVAYAKFITTVLAGAGVSVAGVRVPPRE
jgi:hypothetical protein